MGSVCSCFGVWDTATSDVASNCWCLNCCENLLTKYQALFGGGGTRARPCTKSYQCVASSNLEVIPCSLLESGSSVDRNLLNNASLRRLPVHQEIEVRKLNVMEIVSNADVEALEKLTRKNEQVGLDCGGDGTKDYCSPKKHLSILEVEPEYSVPSSEDEDVCPTCLEEYTLENPKIITKCSHHYHLSCIFEWQERSETCPSNSFLLSRIPVFDGSGYEIWSSMMRSLFLSQDLWDMVEGGYTEEELTVEALREVRKKDAMALLFILQAIHKSVFSCIAGANKSKDAWDALQKKYQGDAEEPNRQNPVDELVLSCPADAAEWKEAWDALKMECQGNTDEPSQKKAVDESVLSCAADATEPKEAAWDAPEQGYKANTKVVEANRIGIEFGDFSNNCGFKEGCSDDRRFKMNHSDNSTPAAESAFHSKLKLSEDGIGKESGDIKNNNCGSKKGSRGISNRGGRGGRNAGRFNNNQGGRGGQGRGHINNNRGGHGGKGRGHINNNRGGRGGKDHGHSNNNQRDCRGTDSGCFNSNKGRSGGIDSGHFNKGSEAADYNSKNAKFESASSCTTNATESKEASDVHALQQGHQANTEVHAQPQAGNPTGGVNHSLTSLFVGDLDVNVTDSHLFGIFSHFGQVVSATVCRDMASQCSLGYGYVTYGNPQDAAGALKVLNFAPLNGKPIRIMYPQQDSTEHKSGARNIFIKSLDKVIDDNQGGCGGLDHGGFNSKKSNYNNNQGGHVGIDGGCFSNKDSEFSDYNSKNPNFESVSSSSTNATESKEASDALQQGHQANTEDLNSMALVKAQPQVGNPGGVNIFIKNLDKAIDDEALRAIFSAFGNILSCKVVTDASGQSKGYGYMEYDSEQAAQKAIEKVNGMLLNDKKVYVGPFVSKQERAKAREMTKFTNVYVGNLSESTTEEDLRKVFDYFGTIVSIVVMRDGDGKSKCFGFVNFKDADDVAWCMEVLNGHKFDNKEWCVRRASQKKFVGKAQKKSGDESVPSSTANATESIKAGDAVSQKKFVGRTQKKSVDESVPSSTAKATESKNSGDAVSQKKYVGKAKKKSVDESVLSSTANATESKKAGKAVQKGYRANTRVLYVDNKGVAHFKLNSP